MTREKILNRLGTVCVLSAGVGGAGIAFDITLMAFGGLGLSAVLLLVVAFVEASNA